MVIQGEDDNKHVDVSDVTDTKQLRLSEDQNPNAMNIASVHVPQERTITESSRLRRSSHGNFGFVGYDSDDDSEDEEEEIKTMCWTTMLVRHPCLVHFTVMVLAIVCVIVSLSKTTVTRISADSLLPDNNIWCDNQRAVQAVEKELYSEFTMPQTATNSYLYTQLFFKLTDEEQDRMKKKGQTPWILTPRRLKTIVKYEKKYITKNKKWIDLCFLEAGVGRKVTYSTDVSSCNGAVTSLTLTYASMLNYDYDSMTTEGIKAFVKLALDNVEDTATLFDPMVTKKVSHSDNLTAVYYRSIFKAAHPWPTKIKVRNITVNETTGEWVEIVNKSSSYENMYDRVGQQQIDSIVDDFGLPMFKEIDVEHNGELVDNDMRIRSYIAAVWLYYNNIAMIDSIAVLYTIAIVVILIYTTYDIGSAFLSFAAFWEIVATVPISWFTYRIILNIPQLGGLNFGILFVLFSVGVYYHPAYVFVDHWMQSKHIVEDHSNWEKRMAIAWRATAAAVGIAQSTTFVSFASAGIGSIMWFRSFGIWAGLAILVNYLLGITLYPCSIIIWELYARPVEKRLSDWLTGRGLSRISFNVAEKYHARYMKQQNEVSTSVKGIDTTSLMLTEGVDQKKKEKTIDVGYGPQTYAELKEEYRKLGFILGVFWPPRLWKARYFVIAVLLVWGAWASYCCTQLERLEESEAFHGEDSFFYKSQMEMKNYALSENDRNAISLVWGITGMVEGSRNTWDAFDYGDPNYVPIDIYHPTAQKHIKRVCRKIRKAKHLVDEDHHVKCWIDDFETWLSAEKNTSFPVQNIKKQKFYNWMYDWLHHSSDGLEWVNKARIKMAQKKNGDAELLYFKIAVRSKYLFWSTTQEADSDQLNWISMEDEINKECLDTVKNGKEDNVCNMKQISLRWGFTESYKEFTESAIQACVLTLPVVFIILILVLHNWIMATICVLNVLFIMVSCLSVIQMAGWKFGVMECCAVILCLGFSVDYCVHIAHGYISSPVATDRFGRVRYSLLTTGHAIASSAFLSSIATVPLFAGAKYMMFIKIGVLTVCTILFSSFLSFTFFTLMLLAAAPKGKAGYVPIQKYLCKCACLRGKASFSKHEGV